MFTLEELLQYTYDGRISKLQEKGIRVLLDAGDLITYKKIFQKHCNLELLPIISNSKYGFIDKEGNVKIEPIYEDYKGSFIASTSNNVCVKKSGKWGSISSDGNVVIDLIYSCIKPSIMEFEEFYYDNGVTEKIYYDMLYVVNKGRKWATLDKCGNAIVDFGVYDWIDGFDHKLARVRKGKQWGIIDYTGKLVLPIEWDEVQEFYGKNKTETLIKKDGIKLYVKFCDLITADDNRDEECDTYCNNYIDRSAYDNPYYNDALDFDQQDQEFWENL